MKNFISDSFQDQEYRMELKRKFFHFIFIALLPLLYIFMSKSQILFLVVPIAIIIIAIDFCRHKNPQINLIFSKLFGHILREREIATHSWTGASFMAIAALLVFSICPKAIAICAFSILAISDCLAAVIGKRVVSEKFFEKSVAGSIAFGSSAVVILIICGIFTNQGFGYYLFGICAVFAATIIEARPSLLGIDDNLTIPVTFSTVMMFFGLVWGLQY
ncbi:MAG: Cytidylyltransferase family protein [Rickettsiaceae bacterium]|jgi:dolichol kinase|nr:Cytidylyltransferase family protein [Rickettsiaceae bacterium]